MTHMFSFLAVVLEIYLVPCKRFPVNEAVAVKGGFS